MSNMMIIFFGLLFSLHVRAEATDTITAGLGLSGKDTLISSNGKFALGFFQPFSKSSSPDASSWYLGIWFNTVPKFTPAWVANGDKPVVGPTSPELAISDDGNLVIIDQTTKSIIWSTRANTTANSTRAMLLKTGNLVLQSTSNSSQIFWQSFDYPTDTHLAGAKLGRDKVTGLNRRLVSRKNSMDPAPGMYTYELHEKNGSARFGLAAHNSSIPYWSSGEWNGHFFGSIPEMSGRQLIDFTFINNEKEVYFTYTLLDEATIMRFSLNVSGQVKILLWVERAQEWVTAFSNPDDQCNVYGVCGPFTTCGQNKLPHCSCMEGFSIRSPDDWELEDRTGGCIRNTPLDCGINSNTTSMQDQFFPMPCVSLPDNGHKIQDATSAAGCAKVCLGNCNCTAYSYGNRGCFVWDDKLTNVKQQQCGNGNNNQALLYLRLADKEVQRLKSNRRRRIIGIVIGASFALFGLLSLLLLLMSRRLCSHRMKNLQGGGGIIMFRYADLQRATNNFSQKLGTGGFGSVFKGFLNESSDIAVKRLDGARQGEKQFRAEVRSIGTIQHINLVKLIGFCTEGDRRLIVYEYMQNRSLEAHLFQSNATGLKWSIRYQIALGVARGLVYLHDNCRDCIIHCDIKPENILLDASFVPKIADFGLAKFLGRDFSQALTTMRGTIGYLAPEWLSGTVITAKVDVYSYGMVLLEILSGKRNSGRQCTTGDDYDYFPVKVANKLLEGGVGSLVDDKLHGDVNLEQVERAFKVACWCIQDVESDRPTMGQVVQYLEGFVEVDIPPMPRLLQVIAANALGKSDWYLDPVSQEAGKLEDVEGSAQHQVAQP